MAKRTLIVPAARVRTAPAIIREDGTTEPTPGTVLVADDGGLIGNVSDVLAGDPVDEDPAASGGPAKRVAYSAEFTDAALATVRTRLAAAVVADDLPANWRHRKGI